MNLDFVRNDFRFNARTSVVIYNKDLSKVLLFNVEGRNFYMLPGGRIEELEESIDTIKREIKEETGLIITNYKLVYVSPIFENHPVLKPFLNIGYLCFVDNSDVIISDEHLDYKWVSVKELAIYLDNEIFSDLKINGMIRELERINH